MLIILRYSTSYEILCKFNVYQQPRSRPHPCIYHTYLPGNPIQPTQVRTALAPRPLTSSQTTSLELPSALLFNTCTSSSPHLHGLSSRCHLVEGHLSWEPAIPLSPDSWQSSATQGLPQSCPGRSWHNRIVCWLRGGKSKWNQCPGTNKASRNQAFLFHAQNLILSYGRGRECCRCICTIKPLHAGERLCPRSPEAHLYHKVKANENNSTWQRNKKNRIQDPCCKYWTGISFFPGLTRRQQSLTFPLEGNYLWATPVF